MIKSLRPDAVNEQACPVGVELIPDRSCIHKLLPTGQTYAHWNIKARLLMASTNSVYIESHTSGPIGIEMFKRLLICWIGPLNGDHGRMPNTMTKTERN